MFRQQYSLSSSFHCTLPRPRTIPRQSGSYVKFAKREVYLVLDDGSTRLVELNVSRFTCSRQYHHLLEFFNHLACIYLANHGRSAKHTVSESMPAQPLVVQQTLTSLTVQCVVTGDGAVGKVRAHLARLRALASFTNISWLDMSSHIIHHECVPWRIHTHSVQIYFIP